MKTITTSDTITYFFVIASLYVKILFSTSIPSYIMDLWASKQQNRASGDIETLFIITRVRKRVESSPVGFYVHINERNRLILE